MRPQGRVRGRLHRRPVSDTQAWAVGGSRENGWTDRGCSVMKHKVYIVATNDRDLKRRIRKIPGVPIMSVARGKYVIERLPDAPEK